MSLFSSNSYFKIKSVLLAVLRWLLNLRWPPRIYVLVNDPLWTLRHIDIPCFPIVFERLRWSRRLRGWCCSYTRRKIRRMKQQDIGFSTISVGQAMLIFSKVRRTVRYFCFIPLNQFFWPLFVSHCLFQKDNPVFVFLAWNKIFVNKLS